MRFTRFTATAALAIGATAVTAGAAYAQPLPTYPKDAKQSQQQHVAAPTYRAVDHGVGYTTTATDKGVVTALDAGTFVVARDAKTVQVRDKAGHTVASVPLTVAAGNQKVALTPSIDKSGKSLTLTAVGAPVKAKQVNAQRWFFNELQRASLGGIVGAIIGGIVLGIFPLPVVGIIPGAIIGGTIGLLLAGGQPLVDSGVAYFTGH